MAEFPKFTIREMLESGVHFGHKQRAWNPKMAPFIYGLRNKVHIIDLQQTFTRLHKALKAIEQLILRKPNAKILFVGTKNSASSQVKEAALRCGQFYVDRRWLGGTLTNWNTISKSIVTMENLEKKAAEAEAKPEGGYNKKEILNIRRHAEKLERVLGGIRKLKGKPDLIFIIDANTEHIAIKEAGKFNIPIVAVVDTNSDPGGIEYIVPGNDDSSKSVKFFTTLMSNVILYATAKAFEESGVVIEEFRQKMEAAEPELISSVSDESMRLTDKEVSEFFNVGDEAASEEASMEEEAALATDSEPNEAAKKPTESSRSQASSATDSKAMKPLAEEKKTTVKAKLKDKEQKLASQEASPKKDHTKLSPEEATKSPKTTSKAKPKK